MRRRKNSTTRTPPMCRSQSDGTSRSNDKSSRDRSGPRQKIKRSGSYSRCDFCKQFGHTFENCPRNPHRQRIFSPRTSTGGTRSPKETGWQVVGSRKKTACKKIPRTSSKKQIEPDIFRDVKAGKIYSVRATLRRGEFDVNCFFAGRTALHWAARTGNAKMVAWILEYKADISLRAKHRGSCSGFTALDFASMAPGDPETVARLLMAEVSAFILGSLAHLHSICLKMQFINTLDVTEDWWL